MNECCLHVMKTAPAGRRGYFLMFHLINAGEITVGEAREELKWEVNADTRALLGGWVFDRADQGDNWRAGDPVRLPDGRVVRYEDETLALQRPQDFEQTGDETWELVA